MCRSVAQHYVDMLLGDECWQGAYTDDERRIWLSAASAHLRLAMRYGRDMVREYGRVRRILLAGRDDDEF